jgi:hypothetical protein
VDWSLFGCARKGHVTYAPDEPDLRDRLTAPTAGYEARLRTDSFIEVEQAALAASASHKAGSTPR